MRAEYRLGTEHSATGKTKAADEPCKFCRKIYYFKKKNSSLIEHTSKN
jgi:hypothetical protein